MAIAGDAVDVDDDIDEDSDMTTAGVAPPGAQAVPLRSPEGYMCEPTAGLGPPRQDAAPGGVLTCNGMYWHVCLQSHTTTGCRHTFEQQRYHRGCTEGYLAVWESGRGASSKYYFNNNDSRDRYPAPTPELRPVLMAMLSKLQACCACSCPAGQHQCSPG